MKSIDISNVTEWVLSHAYIILTLFAIVAGLATWTATGLQIEPNFSALISDEGTYNTNERKIEQTFQQNSGVLLYYSLDEESILKDRPTSLNTSEFRNHIEQLRGIVQESQYVVDVGQLSIREQGDAAALSLSLYVPNEVNIFKDVKAELDAYVEEVPPPPGIDVIVSGFPTILDRTATLLISDNLRTVFITLLLVFLILYLYFLDIRLVLIGVTVPLFGLIFLMAMMVLLDIYVTLTLAAVGVLVLGLGADYSIHMTITFERLIKKGMSRHEAVLETVNELLIPISASYLTTLAGFLALTLGVSPSSISQGIVLSIGITIIYILSICVIPLFLSLLPASFTVKENRVFDAIRDKMAEIGAYQAERPWLVVGIVLGITVVLGAGLSQVYFSTSNSNWIPEDDPVNNAFRDYSYKFGGSDSVSLVIEAKDDDLRNIDYIRHIQRIQAQVDGIYNVERIQSPFSNVPLDPSTSREILTNNRDAFNNDFTFTTVQISSGAFEPDEDGNSIILQELRNILQNNEHPGLDISLYGDVVRFEELGQSLQQDTGITTMVGLGMIFLISSLIYTSVVIGLTALVPIILAVIWAVGLMGYLGVPFTSLSTGLISLVLGIGVDFSIHLVDSIKRLAPQTEDVKEAIYQSLNGSGSAILVSSITTWFGFLALTFSTLLGTRRFGWSLALSIVGVFGVCILLVPAIVSIQLRRKYT